MRLDITMTRGDTRTFELPLLDENGTAYDFTGAEIAFKTALFTATVGDGIAVDESSGDVTLTVSPTDTEDAPDVRMAYPYDVQVTLADGTVNTPQRGLFIVLPDVLDNT